jgi:hypothetical protein
MSNLIASGKISFCFGIMTALDIEDVYLFVHLVNQLKPSERMKL